jgi:tetratricopeptide (TPR) repeat protein
MTSSYAPHVRETVLQKFMGRGDALAAFYTRLAYRHMKNGVYYYGGGGLGKTWILQKILLDYSYGPCHALTCFIDFFDTRNHSTLGLQTAIRSGLSAPETFRAYDEALQRLNDLRSQGGKVQLGALASLEARANKVFIECCQRAIEGREVILLLDTFERVQQRFVGRWLLQQFLPNVRSLIVAIAGRPSPSPAVMPDNIVCFPLKGLTLEEARAYIHREAAGASEQVVEAIWTHTGGAPLFMELILDLPTQRFDQLLEELNGLEENVLVQDLPRLKNMLVGEFARPCDLNRTIWAMAYLWRRFDASMLRYVADRTGHELVPLGFDQIREKLAQYVYLKEYAQQPSLSLHDEVRDMLAVYVLPAVDPNRDIQARLYEFIVDHYYPEAVAVADRELERQLRAEQLGYILDSSPDNGLHRYEDYRDRIESTHDYDFEELLWGEVREHLGRFGDDGFRVCRERGEWLHKHSLFQKAEEHYREMVPGSIREHVETKLALGFMLMRQGKIREAKTEFEESRVPVSRDDYHTLATVENDLGQANELAGEWNQALRSYALGLRAAMLAHDYPLMASVYLNRGYLYCLQGQYEHAIAQCKLALELLSRLPATQDNTRRTVYAWMNLGTAHRYSADYSGAAKHYEESLKLARQSRNWEAVADAFQHLGSNAHQWGRDLRRTLRDPSNACALQLQASRHLAEALEMAHESDWKGAIADGLHRMAHIYREVFRLRNLPTENASPDLTGALQTLECAMLALQMPFEVEYEHELWVSKQFTQLDWLEKATRLFEVSAVAADEANKPRRALDSLTEVAAVLLELRHYDLVPSVVRRIERIQGSDYQEELFAAIGEIILGDLHFEQQQYSTAREKYETAYPKLARQSGYAAYLLTNRLRMLRWRLSTLPRVMILCWCDALEDAWLAQSPPHVLPDMLDMLERVRNDALTTMELESGQNHAG